MSADPLQFQLAEHDRRLGGHHKRLGAIEVRLADQDTAIAVLEHDVKDLDEKVDGIVAVIKESNEKREAEGAANRKALYTLAAFMATFSTTIIGLIIALVGHA